MTAPVVTGGGNTVVVGGGGGVGGPLPPTEKNVTGWSSMPFGAPRWPCSTSQNTMPSIVAVRFSGVYDEDDTFGIAASIAARADASAPAYGDAETHDACGASTFSSAPVDVAMMTCRSLSASCFTAITCTSFNSTSTVSGIDPAGTLVNRGEFCDTAGAASDTSCPGVITVGCLGTTNPSVRCFTAARSAPQPTAARSSVGTIVG